MVLYDDRFTRMQMVWGIGASGAMPRFTTSATEHAGAAASIQKGQAFWSFHERGLNKALHSRIGQDGSGVVGPYKAGMTDLGYARNAGGPLPTTAFTPQSGHVLLIPGGTKHSVNRSVVVAGATTTHTLNLNLSGGGIIDAWTINNASFSNVQMLNRYDSYMRGIQVAASWVDANNGELVRHAPRQGGNYWSLPTLGTTFTSPGSYCLGTTVTSDNGATLIEALTIPLDMDPDGGYAMPGLNTQHNGSRYNPVIWQDMRTRLRLWVNYQGIENLHRLDAHVYFPWAINTAYFDAEVYAPIYLDAARFAQVWAYDPVPATSTQISNGTSGLTYYLDDRRTYHMGTSGTYGNDTGSLGASFLPGGSGLVGARGVAPSGLAFGVYAIDTMPPGSTYNLGTMPGGNTYVWAQSRGGASGQDGDNCVLLAHGAMLSGRLQAYGRKVTIPQGWVGSTRYLLTDSWTNVVSKVASIQSRGLF